MINPYILLGLLVFWLASVAGAYYKGAGAAQDAIRAEYATKLEETIAEHRENALIDMEAAMEAGRRDAKARTRTVTITNEVERVIHANPAPADCRVHPDTFRLLQSAVANANGASPDTPGAMPDASGAATPAGK